MKSVRRKGSLLLGLSLVVILIVILSTAAPTTGTIIKSVTDENFKNQAYLIDDALSVWCSSHGGRYPDSLMVLSDMGFLSQQIDFNNFTYTLQSDQTLYRLTINLNNGSTYKSVGSKF